MEFIIGSFLFTAGLFFGALFCHHVVIHVGYQFPKSIYMVAKGLLKPVGIFIVLLNPVLFLGLTFAIGYFFPSLHKYLDRYPAFGLASNIGLGYCLIISIFTKKGRLEELNNFWEGLLKYTTENFYSYAIRKEQELNNEQGG